jgi:hypothetical protein
MHRVAAAHEWYRAPGDTGCGGASRDRTGDLLLAKQALSQLSYGPSSEPPRNGGSGKIRTSGLALIRGAL